MGHPRYTKEEIAARGQAIYEQQLRPRVEPEHAGLYLVIDIETGDYEMDEDEAALCPRAYARFPGAPLYGMRIGSRAWGRIGGHRRPDAPMIRGHVNASRQPIISLQLSGPNGQTATVDALVDTGFDGLLALPPDLAARLELPFGMTRSYEIGDGRTVPFDLHRAAIVWDGQPREVAAVITTGGVLIGMALLQGHSLFVDVMDGGEVRIQPHP